MAYFVKQTDEVFPIAADFSGSLGEGETLTSEDSTITAYDDQGQDVTDEILVSGSKAISGSQLLIKVQAGTDEDKYKITFKAVTNDNNVYELDVFMLIQNV